MTQGVVSAMLSNHPVLVCLLRSLDLLSAKRIFFFTELKLKLMSHVSLISEIYFCLPCVFRRMYECLWCHGMPSSLFEHLRACCGSFMGCP
jgi:hypothetical protein